MSNFAHKLYLLISVSETGKGGNSLTCATWLRHDIQVIVTVPELRSFSSMVF